MADVKSFEHPTLKVMKIVASDGSTGVLSCRYFLGSV